MEKKPNQQSPQSNNLEQIQVRNIAVMRFNSMAFKQAILAAVTFGSVLFVLSTVGKSHTPSQFVPVDAEMRYETPLSKTVHNRSDSEIATYTADTMKQMLSFDWYNITEQLNRQVGNFTNQGWLGFKDNLEKSGLMNYVIDTRSIISFQVGETPKVVAKGEEEVDGEKTAYWTVQLKGKVLYINSGSGQVRRSDETEMLIRLVRVSTLESDTGVAIHRTNIKFR